MPELLSRRRLMTLSALALPVFAGSLGSQTTPKSETMQKEGASRDSVPTPGDLFPTQPPDIVREMVLVSHFNLKRVKELVGSRPSLAKAAWDWGFGDWETALGAASHMGNRPIAEYLLANGAQPSIFSAAMLGHVDVVKSFVTASPGIQRTAGPHSISLLAHAKAGGEQSRAVYDYLHALGDADQPPEAPLSDQDRASILGTYVFGSGPTQQINVTIEQGKLTWTRKGTMGRWIYHDGNRAFYPCGAPAVKIRFTGENDGVLMTVSDPDVVLVARRS